MTRGGDRIEIRPFDSLAERRACVRLQEETWGPGFTDRVPASMLMIALETGGVASGAFDGDELVGFVFGITGLRDGEAIHWSDMLAVRPSHRGLGIGYRLKLHQRDLLLPHGVGNVLWTFDPLEARNAYLNLRRLGAVARTYRRDVYGDSPSPLHSVTGTDRLLAEWWIDSDRVRDRLDGRGDDSAGGGPLLNPPRPGGPYAAPSDAVGVPEGDRVEVAIPAAIQQLKRDDPGLAVAWRENVRAALERCIEGGYTAMDLVRDGGDGIARYVLARGLAR